MTVSEARAALPDVIQRVTDGEEITVTRHGTPVAVVVRPDALRSRRAGPTLSRAEQIHKLLTAAGKAPLSAPSLTEDRADELIRDVRAGREAR